MITNAELAMVVKVPWENWVGNLPYCELFRGDNPDEYEARRSNILQDKEL